MTVAIHNLRDTWNDGAVTFTSLKMNVTDTASAPGSLLMDLRVDDVSKFSVTKDGGLSIKGGSTLLGLLSAAAVLDFGTIGANASKDLTVTDVGAVEGDAVAISVPASLPADLIYFGWVSAADTVTIRAINPTGGAVVVPADEYRVLVFRF